MPGLAAVKAALRQYALTFDGTHEDHPWGETVIKVHGKVFAFFGVDDDTRDGLMGVKLARSLLYRAQPPARRADGLRAREVGVVHGEETEGAAST